MLLNKKIVAKHYHKVYYIVKQRYIEVIFINNEQLLQFFKAMASEKRQQIMFLFIDGRTLTVNEVAELVSISQSTASEQLAILKRGGLLNSEKKGKEVYYKPDTEKISVNLEQLTTYLKMCCK